MTSAQRALPRILLAWEYGSNFGHWSRLRTLSHELKIRGASIQWAIPQRYAQKYFQEISNDSVNISPVIKVSPSQSEDHRSLASGRMHSFAEVLLALGFGDANALDRSINKWLAVYKRLKPSMIVCDYAPCALLAARVAQLPTTILTNGFDAPPADFPAFEDEIRGPYVDKIRKSNINLLSAIIDRVADDHGVQSLALANLFEHPTKIIDVITEVDPYGRTRINGRHIGPFENSINLEIPVWKYDTREKKIFVYIRSPTAMKVLEKFSRINASIFCVWPEATDFEINRYTSAKLQISQRPINLKIAMQEADAVINYASSSMVCSTAIAGLPQMMYPTDVEKLMIAKKIDRQGIGFIAPPQDACFAESIERLLEDTNLSQAAQEISKKYSMRNMFEEFNSALEEILCN